MLQYFLPGCQYGILDKRALDLLSPLRDDHELGEKAFAKFPGQEHDYLLEGPEIRFVDAGPDR
jgi:hypothetical protein